jgi:hypothetical protein
MRFDNFINEKAIMPDIKFVRDELTKNKDKILACTTNKQVDKVFNDIFNNHWVLIFTTNLPTADCSNKYWAIHSGYDVPSEKSSIGSVVSIKLGKDFIKNLYKAKEHWDIFCEAFETIIGHEFVHVNQIQKIPMNIWPKVFKSHNTDAEYLAMKFEITAFAFQSVKEFIFNGFTLDEVLNRIRKPFDKNLSPSDDYSDTFWAYTKYFKADDKTLKKFLNTMYEYCMQFKN